MRNRKLKIMIVGSIGIVVVLGVCGLFAVDYAATRVMDSFAAELEDDSMDAAKLDADSFEGAKLEADSVEAAKKGSTSTTAPKEAGEAKQKKGDDSIGKPTGTVTKEQAKKVRDNLTVSDKAKVVSVLIKSLNLSDLKTLQMMASGGLTVEEKREAKQLLIGKLSSDKYNELSALAKKYGISRGKTYNEAKQELNS
jgi:hypothetical protein